MGFDRRYAVELVSGAARDADARGIHLDREPEKAVQLIGRARYPATDAFMRGVTFFGSVPGGAIASLAGIALARKRPRAVMQIVVASIGGITAELIVKRSSDDHHTPLIRRR